MNNSNLIIGIVALAGGLLLLFIIGQRRFKRRNAAGLQQYRSYGKGMVTSFLERIGKLLAYALIVLGAFILMGIYLVKQSKQVKTKTEPHQNELQNKKTTTE